MKRLLQLTATSILSALLVSGCSDKVVAPDAPMDTGYKIVYTKPPADPSKDVTTVMTVDTSGHGDRLMLGIATSTGTNRILYALSTTTYSRGADIMTSDNRGFGIADLYDIDTNHYLYGPPQLSANGKYVAFVLRDTGIKIRRHLYTTSVEQPTPRELTENISYETLPGLSSDGQYVAYYQTLDSVTSLVVSRTDGSAANKIAGVTGSMVDFAGEVAWNPDGTRLAYTDNDEVYVINKDGSNQVHVGHGLQPRWSPDGSTLAFVQNPGDFMWDIVLTTDLGTTVRNITNTNAQWELYPQWSPDGKYIVCQTGTGDPENGPSSIKLITVATAASKSVAPSGILPFFTR